MPTMVSKERWSIVSAGGCSFWRDLVEAGDVGVLAEPDQERIEPGIPIPPLTLPSVQIPPRYSVWSGPPL